MKRQCYSTTKDGIQCTKSRLRFSRYCIYHQDIGILLTIWGIMIGIIGIIFSVGTAFYQDKHPILQVICDVTETGDPSILKICVTNSGRLEAKDIYLSFTDVLPFETEVYGRPEYGLQIIESKTLPDPYLHPEIAKTQKAFSIFIPRIAAHDSIKFEVHTQNIDNKRAAKQILLIREEIEVILNDFVAKVKERYPEYARWNIQSLIASRIKEESFFLPAKVSYESGVFDISFFTDEEIYARALNMELYPKYKKQFINVFKERRSFIAPVIRTKTNNSNSTLAIFPPYVSTYLNFRIPSNELILNDSLLIYPPIPEKYDWE